ncbi:arcC, partial [Symbiodinium sp. KB8]
GQWPPVLLDGDDKKLPKHACLRLVVPDIIRIAKAKLPVVEVLEERPAKRRAVEPAPGKPQAPPAREAKKDDLWEVVEDGSTTAPSTEAEVPEPTEQPVTNEPAVSQDRALGPSLVRQPDIVATLINPQDADVVATWSQAHCKKLSLEGSPRSQRERSRSPRRCKHAAEEEQAEAAQPAEVPEAEPAAVAEPESALPDADAKPAEEPEHKPADAKPAEEAKPKRCLETQHREQGLVGEICDSWLDLYLDDKAIYDDARERVESGFLDGWVLDCEMILDMEVTQLKELPKFGCLKAEAQAALAARQERARTHQLSDQDRAQVKRILSCGGEVWGASQDSERTVLFQKTCNGLSFGQLAPDFFAKLINPKRDGELVDAWCETVGREPRMMAYGKRGEFMLTTDFVQAYCWELSLDSVDAKPAEQAEPADAKPAVDAKPKRCLENQHREQGLVGEIRGKWLELYLDDKAIYDDARVRVESGFLAGWVLDCEMILDMEVTQLKELPKFGCLKAGARIRVQIRSLVDRVEAQYQARREAEARAVLAARQERARTHPLSDQDRAQVKRILSSGGEVWAAAKDSSDSTVLFQKVRDGLSIGQPAPDFFAKLINPKRDKNLVGIWCESVDRAKLLAQGKRGEFWLMSDFVEAYCWQLSLDSVDAKPAEAKDDAVPAPVAEDAKPAEAEDEAKPAPVAEDAKPAVAEDDKPAEQAEDEAEPAVAGEDDQPAAVAEAADAP